MIATEYVECIACGKKEPKRHPGHFLCGHPDCRDLVVNRSQAVGRAYQFLRKINLQDHPVTEQRELLEVVRQLGAVAKPRKL